MLPPDVSAEEVARAGAPWGSTTPSVQYWQFLRGCSRGRNSLRRRTGTGLGLQRVPATLELTAVALGVALLAIPAGIVSAVFRNTALDYVSTVVALILRSPAFWLGIMLILVFAVGFQVLPSSGRGEFAHLIRPALTLGLFTTARTMRLTRSALLGPREDYVRTARAKVSPSAASCRRALRNASIPVITIVGLELGTLLGGAVIIGDHLRLARGGPALGPGHLQPDYPLVQASVFVLASTFVLVNLAVDLLYTYLDPRIRLG